MSQKAKAPVVEVLKQFANHESEREVVELAGATFVWTCMENVVCASAPWRHEHAVHAARTKVRLCKQTDSQQAVQGHHTAQPSSVVLESTASHSVSKWCKLPSAMRFY